ncbi:MAG: PSD1 and planctomycete cytochrome C domain-containing protein, partial [Fuerstiella sp.]|nr:PSD1 and planctomycete cytochrome C domain-containing protein [Fuerstiella sp.]
MRCRIQLITALCLLLVTTDIALAQEVDDSASPVRFNRDIRPILSDKCFQCHGPDAKSREADLRLDERHDAIAGRGGKAAVVGGNAAESGVVERILTDDPDMIMPPVATGKSLTPREITLLRAWIDQGAAYQEHWSFLPVADVDPPVLEPRWSRHVRNPIDQFIFRKLQRKEVSPSSPADSHTLIRRMSLDLIGLLPTPGIVDSFAAQYETNADNAVHGFAREMLNSPHHGERWGRYWLDQARYADSHGYTIDGDRVMWPYRDWVIRAVNDDMPFDRFTIEQLAGDLLPDASKSQLVATGFHRNTLINQEGGTDNEQFRNEEVVDRVNTTGAVWLGLTLGCAQCHSHKFDPVSQKEFYQFFAFFNHTADVNNVGPTVDVSEGELLGNNSDPQLQADLNEAKSALADVAKAKSKRQAEWEKMTQVADRNQSAAEWKPLIPSELHAEGAAELRTLDDQSILAGQGAPMETYTVTFLPTDTPIAALRLRVLTHDSLPKNGPGRASNGNFVLSRVEVLVDGTAVVISHVQSDHDQSGFPASNIVDGNAKTGWAINIGKGSRAGVKMNAPHEAHLVFAEPVISGSGPLTMILRHEVNANYNVGHFAVDASSTAPASVLHEQLLAALGVPADKRTAEHKKLIVSEFKKVDTKQRKAESRVSDLRQKMGLGQTVKTMVMRELDKSRETYIHIRGDFLRKDKETGLLQPDVPRVLPLLQGEGRSRLELARWLVSNENPLTARVTVNRVWMRYFGRGLVETENDFGTQGSFPTHPELLDWLAREFMDSGWSMKKLHELIVASATYRQASHRRSELDAV